MRSTARARESSGSSHVSDSDSEPRINLQQRDIVVVQEMPATVKMCHHPEGCARAPVAGEDMCRRHAKPRHKVILCVFFPFSDCVLLPCACVHFAQVLLTCCFDLVWFLDLSLT